jgi:hypothetical protein
VLNNPMPAVPNRLRSTPVSATAPRAARRPEPGIDSACWLDERAKHRHHPDLNPILRTDRARAIETALLSDEYTPPCA